MDFRIVIDEVASGQGQGQAQPGQPPAPSPFVPPSVGTETFGPEWAVVNGKLVRRPQEPPAVAQASVATETFGQDWAVVNGRLVRRPTDPTVAGPSPFERSSVSTESFGREWAVVNGRLVRRPPDEVIATPVPPPSVSTETFGSEWAVVNGRLVRRPAETRPESPFAPSVSTETFGPEWAVVNGKLVRREQTPQPRPEPSQGSLSSQEADWIRRFNFKPDLVAKQQLEAQRAEEESQKEARDMREAVARARERLSPFDPAAEARKQVEEMDRREAAEKLARAREEEVRREVEALRAFDPVAEARERVEVQERRRRAQAEQMEREAQVSRAMADLGVGPSGESAADAAQRELSQEWRVSEQRRFRKQVEEKKREQVPTLEAETGLGDLVSKALGPVQNALGQLGINVGGGLGRLPQFAAGLQGLMGGGGAGAGAGGAAAAEGAGAAGLLGGGGAALAAVAGPVGVALAAVKMGADALTSRIQEATEDIRRFGGELKMVAGNDYFGLMTERVDLFAEKLGQIPLVGEIYEAQLKQFTTVLRTAADVMNSFVARGRELAQYSGALSAAGAISDVRRIQADIREAQGIGAGIAKMTDAQSRIEVAIRDTMLPLKGVVTNIEAFLAERLANNVEGLTSAFTTRLDQLVEQEREGGKKQEAWFRSIVEIVDLLRRLVGMGEDPKGSLFLLGELSGDFAPPGMAPDPAAWAAGVGGAPPVLGGF